METDYHEEGTCLLCHGTGVEFRYDRTGREWFKHTCALCWGSGKDVEESDD